MKKIIIPVLLVIAASLYWSRSYWQDQTQITLYGNVDIREAQLSFNATEQVEAVHVQEGDEVKKGQLLAELDGESFRARLEQAQALLEAKRQQLSKLLAGNRPEEIEKAQAELNAAKIKAKLALDTWQRLEKLAKKKLVSHEEVEIARSNADAAQAQVEAAQASLKLLQLGARKEDIAIAEIEVVSAQASVDLAQAQLNDTFLYAPDDGIIRTRILEPGDMANPSKPAISFAFIDPVWVRTYLPEAWLGRVKPGMRVQIETDSYPDKRYLGWIGYISPTAEFTPKNIETPELRTRLVYQMRVLVCNPQRELRLGMPATVYIDLEQPVTEKPACRE